MNRQRGDVIAVTGEKSLRALLDSSRHLPESMHHHESCCRVHHFEEPFV